MSAVVVFYSISDFAALLGKSSQRVYQMMHEGLLQETGIGVYRTEKGRVWLRTHSGLFDSPQPRDGKKGNRRDGNLSKELRKEGGLPIVPVL